MPRKRKQVVASVMLVSIVIVELLVGRASANRYEELGGRHQGDIVLMGDQFDASVGSGIPIVHDAFKWFKGIVPYEISPVFSPPQADQIEYAMRRVSTYSCVRFTRRTTSDRQFLNVTGSPTGCWATLGMNMLLNQLNLDPSGCLRTGVIMHQLMHVLGLTHPQSRSDRNLYIRVQEDAIEPTQKTNLDKYQPGTVDDYGMPYDYESILHCQSDAFGSTTSGGATVVPLDDVEIGQRDVLSLKDVRKLNKMYSYEFCGHCLRGNCLGVLD